MAASLTFHSCQTEELESLDNFSTSGQEIEMVDIEYDGQMVSVQKIENDYLLDDMILNVTEDGYGKKAASTGNKWTNGVVYYSIDSSLGESSEEAIGIAINHYKSRTPITFTKRTNQSNYILFRDDGTNGCNSYVGMIGGVQHINMGGCKTSIGGIIHEIMHAIGFRHEHQRNDRDDYIIINYDNTDFPQYFTKMSGLNGITPFDFNSIVMYAPLSWNNNGLPVMTKKNGDDWGSRDTWGLSVLDVRGIEAYYDTGAATIAIRGNNGGYVTSSNGQSSMICNRAVINAWEEFELWSLSNGKVALKGSNGKFVSSEDGRKAMTCNRSSIGDWEQFEIVFYDDYKFSLKGSNGKYVSSSDGKTAMVCNRSAVAAWEKFQMWNRD